MTQNPSPRTVAITGCSSGFGRITALHLARRGWQVFATVRREADQASLEAEAQAHNLDHPLTVLRCDITREAEVQDLGARLAEAAPHLSGLVNNAGTAYASPLELLPLDALRAQLEVNVIGQVGVTQALLPQLKRARGTIINVSSQGGRLVAPITGAYHASKFALEAISDAWRIELAPFRVRVVVIEPSASPTAIWRTSRQRALAGLAARGAESAAYQPLIEAVLRRALGSEQGAGFPPQLFADTVQRILDSPHPRARYAIPRRTAFAIALRKLMPDALWDRLVRTALNW